MPTTDSKIWLHGMDSNHELDKNSDASQLIDSTKSLKSSKASKAGCWYKICTKYSSAVLKSSLDQALCSQRGARPSSGGPKAPRVRFPI